MDPLSIHSLGIKISELPLSPLEQEQLKQVDALSLNNDGLIDFTEWDRLKIIGKAGGISAEIADGVYHQLARQARIFGVDQANAFQIDHEQEKIQFFEGKNLVLELIFQGGLHALNGADGLLQANWYSASSLKASLYYTHPASPADPVWIDYQSQASSSHVQELFFLSPLPQNEDALDPRERLHLPMELPKGRSDFALHDSGFIGLVSQRERSDLLAAWSQSGMHSDIAPQYRLDALKDAVRLSHPRVIGDFLYQLLSRAEGESGIQDKQAIKIAHALIADMLKSNESEAFQKTASAILAVPSIAFQSLLLTPYYFRMAFNEDATYERLTGYFNDDDLSACKKYLRIHEWVFLIKEEENTPSSLLLIPNAFKAQLLQMLPDPQGDPEVFKEQSEAIKTLSDGLDGRIKEKELELKKKWAKDGEDISVACYFNRIDGFFMNASRMRERMDGKDSSDEIEIWPAPENMQAYVEMALKIWGQRSFSFTGHEAGKEIAIDEIGLPFRSLKGKNWFDKIVRLLPGTENAIMSQINDLYAKMADEAQLYFEQGYMVDGSMENQGSMSFHAYKPDTQWDMNVPLSDGAFIEYGRTDRGTYRFERINRNMPGITDFKIDYTEEASGKSYTVTGRYELPHSHQEENCYAIDSGRESRPTFNGRTAAKKLEALGYGWTVYYLA